MRSQPPKTPAYIRRAVQNRAGFTLLETVIALGVWLILSAAIIFAWQYTANTSAHLIARNHAFENARFAMDTMLTNIRLYDSIYITHAHPAASEYAYVMHRLIIGTGRGSEFNFIAPWSPFTARRGRIERPDGGNELARHIALVRVIYHPGTRIDIIIKTDCEQPVILEGSACVRYKRVTVAAPAGALP